MVNAHNYGNYKQPPCLEIDKALPLSDLFYGAKVVISPGANRSAA